MNKCDSNKVLSHIDEAKNWLDEAKEEYTQSNQVRGELNLNLAQAEVKYAWELSRQRNVTPSVQPVPLRRVHHYFFPAAAACLIILVFTGGFFWLKQTDKNESSALTAKTNNLPIARSGLKQEITAAKVIDKPVTNDLTVNLPANHNPSNHKEITSVSTTNTVSAKPRRKIAKAEGIKQTPKALPAAAIHPQHPPVTTDTQAQQVNVADNTVKTVTPENQSVKETPIERDFVPKVSKLTVAALVIDEEALTKEASYSLQNGK